MGFKSIGIGWYRKFAKTATEEEKRKAKICHTCEYAKPSIVGDKSIPEVDKLKCGLCGCPLAAKIRSLDECEKWIEE